MLGAGSQALNRFVVIGANGKVDRLLVRLLGENESHHPTGLIDREHLLIVGERQTREVTPGLPFCCFLRLLIVPTIE